MEYAKKRYFVKTYGCQMNGHDSEKICGMLEEMGYVPSAQMEAADLIVFNTCCIRDNAEQKVIGNVGALKALKDENKELLIAVVGCMTQQPEAAEKLFRTFPFVDIVLGTHNIRELPQHIEDRLDAGKRVLAVPDSDGTVEEGISITRGSAPLASVNIMYGCNNFCSYCIVPYVRGRERSRRPENVIREVSDLVAQGYREVLLLGQNVNSYRSEVGVDFPALLDQICDKTPIERIRFMTSHPKDLSAALIAAIRDHPQVCKQLHLPVQSGSTRILARMNRGYTRTHYLSLVEMLRDAIPGIVITTDFIVGFPGETDDDFSKTLSLAEQVRFDAAYTFVYSKRSGTAAAEMDCAVPPEIQRDRIVRLIDVVGAITEEKNSGYVGRIERVLVEGFSARNDTHICGRTDGGKMVNFPGDLSLSGKFADVEITKAKRTTLFGKLV